MNFDRASGKEDADSISHLITSLVDVFVVDKSKAATFLESLSPDATVRRIQSENFHYWVSRSSTGEVDGVIGIKSRTHLYHLFVSKNRQGNGIGSQLWDHANSRLARSVRTVNASFNAVAFYEGLGFVSEGSVIEKDGLRFVPMVLRISESP